MFSQLFVSAPILAGVVMLVPAGPAAAAALRLPITPYAYTIVDQDLRAALQEFGSNQNIKVTISDNVKGRIQGRIPEGTPRAFLDYLSATYNFEWYYDGSVLYITAAQENRTQLLVLKPIAYAQFKSTLDALDIADPRFPIRPAPGKGIVMISGPPRYVSLVEQTLAGLVAEEQGREKPSVKVEAPKPPSLLSLTVFRGSQVTVVRDGRPEYLTGPEQEASRPVEARGGVPVAGTIYGNGNPVTSTGPLPR